ncbi:MAG: hypothetical protein CVU95_15440 [Firmicutes bacterium HGW-Firmicutes-2]|jgi:hypothetical protein|nr:MAG: hypothetical protein CVU95_15440 [Firmicutes bacterium HGW-Firmicutes-2]
MDIEKIINTTVYRILVINQKDLKGFQDVCKLMNVTSSVDLKNERVFFPNYKRQDRVVNILNQIYNIHLREVVYHQSELYIYNPYKLKLEVQKSLDETQILFDSLMQDYFE